MMDCQYTRCSRKGQALPGGGQNVAFLLTFSVSAARTAALGENADIVDLRDALLSNRRFEDLYCADGIHLNDMGQQTLLDYITEKFF